jgi:hypothetical protein
VAVGEVRGGAERRGCWGGEGAGQRGVAVGEVRGRGREAWLLLP